MSAPALRAPRPIWLLTLSALLAATSATAALPKQASSADDDRSQAPSFVLTSDEVEGLAPDQVLPLKASHTSITVAGVVAEVVVRQTWQNKTEAPLEGIYVFPASTRAAVHDLEMTIGDRVVRAEIQEKQQARQTYADARANGQTASLLEQKRPNVFQVAVANILPGEEIDVVLTYAELIVPTGGVYEIVAPQVIGPRYGHGSGSSANDAWTWTPNPYLAKGDAPFAWSVDVDLRTPMAVASIGSPTHALAPSYKSRSRVTAHFDTDADGAGPDRDLVVRYKLQGNAIQTGAMLFRTPREQANFFLLMMEPPDHLEDDAIPPREIVFVVDVSGSMRGFPTDVAKGLMTDLLGGLRPEDRFNLLLFSGGSSLFSEQSVPATNENIEAALTFQEANATYGGTQLARALQRALVLPTSSKTTSRSFVVLTDGYIHAERETFELVRQHVGDANLFSFGVGRGVNRYLIEGLARAGRSEPFFALDEKEAERETERFVKLVSRPALTNVEVTFEGLKVHDVVPANVPDLLAERPLIVFGKYTGPTRGRAIITGRTGKGRFRKVIRIEDNTESKTNRALRTLWARARVQDVSDFTADENKMKKELIRLGLRYRLATAHTSFVAVDKEKRTHKAYRRARQPSAAPAGVDPSLLASTGERSYQKKTVIDFSDVSIEGGLTKPQGSYVRSRRRTSHGSMMPAAPKRLGRSYGVGGLGMRGVGGGGGGSAAGHGRAVVKGKKRKPPGPRKPAPPAKAADPSQIDLDSRSSVETDARGRLSRLLRYRVKKVRACHTDRHYSRPGVHGDIQFRVIFDQQGKVAQVVPAHDSLSDEQLTRCMVDKIQRWRVPRRMVGKDGLTVVFELHFDPLPAKEP